ncbi:hypothetical protein E2C01_016523 [Portunus trituberculatus]|uniref:Uncharacterized protein n=1 Tax=Portunus trituberculatus TaxID=210409 RepID=A0A5B7DQZ7_PORTR|nr:hypothetical protein [Portunus trituberculatus]
MQLGTQRPGSPRAWRPERLKTFVCCNRTRTAQHEARSHFRGDAAPCALRLKHQVIGVSKGISLTTLIISHQMLEEASRPQGMADNPRSPAWQAGTRRKGGWAFPGGNTPGKTGRYRTAVVTLARGRQSLAARCQGETCEPFSKPLRSPEIHF